MSATTTQTRRPRFVVLRLQEGGLLLVIFILGLLLTLLGGTVKMPKFEINAAGERVLAYKVNAAGEREPEFVERNKFLNAQNLIKLAKDTSFIAIMAIGATFVIISGGIDLSVGAVYALASVLGAMVFHLFGPNGSQAEVSPWLSLPLGVLTCVGVATVCGLLNGTMMVTLKVHPFIITLGTMAIYRGVAFVITKGQSIGDFPQAFRAMIGWETTNRLSLVPLGVMVIV